MDYYILPKLPYAFDALEPFIDAKTMKVHYEGHHATYVKKLNEAMAQHTRLRKPVEELLTSLGELPPEIRTTVQNNGGGHGNHALFWTMLSPQSAGTPTGELAVKLKASFGSVETFQEKFTDVAVKHFSNGWAWLCASPAGELSVFSTKDHESPLTKHMTPLLALDLWEHAYYLKHQNKRPDFVKDFWKVANWDEAAARWSDFKANGSSLREWRFAS